MVRQFRIVTAAIAMLAAAGCGIKGPLILPPPTPAVAAKPATAPAADPAPAAIVAPAAPDSAPAARKP